MQNLYDILGVPRNASNKEINAALRQLVRRYNEETAQGAMDSAEALKFVNHARLTFVDPKRRAQYDAELATFEAELAQTSAEAEQEAIAQQIAEDMRRASNTPPASIPMPLPPTASPAPQSPVAVPQPFPPPAPVPRMSRRMPANSTTDALSYDSILTPVSVIERTGQMTFVGTAKAEPGMRRDLGSVLTSDKKTKQRSTTPNPVPRLAARLVDYGLWGILLALVLHYLGSTGTLSLKTVQILESPFIAPVIITLSWTLVEATLLIFFPATPGKFLFNIRVAANVSNPYASNDPGALLSASFLRAFLVWWRGLGAGIVPIYFFTLRRARKRLLASKETSWDFETDCLVTHGEMGIPHTAIVAVLLGGVVWLYATRWVTPFWETMNSGWHYATMSISKTRENWNVVSGRVPTYAKEAPPPPAKENRTVELEKTTQELIDKRDWKALSSHCLAWTKEDERNATAWFCYGRARYELADHNTAIPALKRASLLAPQNDDIRRLIKDSSLANMQQSQLRKRVKTDKQPGESRKTDEEAAEVPWPTERPEGGAKP